MIDSCRFSFSILMLFSSVNIIFQSNSLNNQFYQANQNLSNPRCAFLWLIDIWVPLWMCINRLISIAISNLFSEGLGGFFVLKLNLNVCLEYWLRNFCNELMGLLQIEMYICLLYTNLTFFSFHYLFLLHYITRKISDYEWFLFFS